MTLWLMGNAGVETDSENNVWAWHDQSGNANDATQSVSDLQPTFYGAPGVVGSGLYFSGEGNLLTLTDPPAQNSFTIFAITWPGLQIRIDEESTSGTPGLTGQCYIFASDNQGDNAGACVSLGFNCASVYEYGTDYMPALAVNQTGDDDFHVTCPLVVVYDDKTPTVYVSTPHGAWQVTGLTSPKSIVYAPTRIGSADCGAFTGVVAEILMYWGVKVTV
jgi:hypothetical protein